MRVLLVEDEPKVAAVISDILKFNGFTGRFGRYPGGRIGIRRGGDL